MLNSRHFFSEHAYRQGIKSPVEFALGALRALLSETAVEVPPRSPDPVSPRPPSTEQAKNPTCSASPVSSDPVCDP